MSNKPTLDEFMKTFGKSLEDSYRDVLLFGNEAAIMLAEHKFGVKKLSEDEKKEFLHNCHESTHDYLRSVFNEQ